MANGIDWFRWHHGSVNDPKFGLVAKKAGTRVGDVITVWALVLEQASANNERGQFNDIDCEATDFLLGADDGTTASILDAMRRSRGLIDDGRVTRWDERQPKRERVDTTAAERKRAQRERDFAQSGGMDVVTPGHDMSRHVTPREEERREELTSKASTPDGVDVAGGADDEPPAVKRIECPHQEIIALYHEVLPQCPQVRDWTPARAVQLRARWNEDGDRQNLGYWKRFFEYVATCDFLVGKSSGDRPFLADLEWLTKSSNFTKVRERKYE
jgi:hypothetical protein